MGAVRAGKGTGDGKMKPSAHGSIQALDVLQRRGKSREERDCNGLWRALLKEDSPGGGFTGQKSSSPSPRVPREVPWGGSQPRG